MAVYNPLAEKAYEFIKTLGMKSFLRRFSNISKSSDGSGAGSVNEGSAGTKSQAGAEYETGTQGGSEAVSHGEEGGFLSARACPVRIVADVSEAKAELEKLEGILQTI